MTIKIKVHDDLTLTPQTPESETELMKIVGEVHEIKILNSRTDKQNRYFHKCIGILSETLGYYPDEVKTLFKDSIGFFTTTVNKNGDVIKVYKSTANLSKSDFAEITERLIHFGAEAGVILLTPEEYEISL